MATESESRSFRVVERTSTTVKCTELNELDQSVQKYCLHRHICDVLVAIVVVVP